MVLVLFSFVLLIQFLAMIVHRVITLTHFLGRAPYSPSGKLKTAWSFLEKYVVRLHIILYELKRESVVYRHSTCTTYILL